MNGIYIHIPFCIKKCIYCNFYSETDLSLEDDFVNALIREIQLSGSFGSEDDIINVDTIYLGGGTPSTIKASNISRIINEIYKNYKVSSDTEITIEVNPGTISLKKLADYKKAGINRINAGVQSFNDKNLKFLNRIHSADDARFFIETARKEGFNNIGIDLIHCLPGQSEEMWIKDLKTATSYSLEHLSCYMLTYEHGTPLYTKYKKGEITPANENLSAELFETTINFLSSNGFLHYEISNFASSAKTMSRHNQKYWNFVSYKGFGPSAHSYDAKAGKRYWNTADIFNYIKLLNKNTLPVEDKEYLTNNQQIIEGIFLGLRQSSGIDINKFNKMFSVNFNLLFKNIITKLSDSNMIIIENCHCRLTPKGIMLADKITTLFINVI